MRLRVRSRRLSERSVRTRVHTYARYTCTCVAMRVLRGGTPSLSLPRERGKASSKTTQPAHRRISTLSAASLSSLPFHSSSFFSFFSPFSPSSKCPETEFRKLEFEERGNAPAREEKRRCTREVSGFTATRTEFAGLSRLIRLGNSPPREGIRKRAETAPSRPFVAEVVEIFHR